MNTCERYQELVSAYVDGEASENEAAEMFSHLGACGECREFLSSVLDLRSLFERSDDAPPHAGAPSHFLRRPSSHTRAAGAAAQASVPIWRKKFSIPFPAAAAAIVLLLLSGSLFFVQKSHAPSVVTTLQTEYVCIPAMPIVDVVATPLPPNKSN